MGVCVCSNSIATFLSPGARASIMIHYFIQKCNRLLVTINYRYFITLLTHSPHTTLPQVRLTRENIETILNTLLYDGQAEVTVVAGVTGRAGEESEEEEGDLDIERLYCATRPLVKDTGFSRVPCGVCPVSSLSLTHVCACAHTHTHRLAISLSLSLSFCAGVRGIHTLCRSE